MKQDTFMKAIIKQLPKRCGDSDKIACCIELTGKHVHEIKKANKKVKK